MFRGINSNFENIQALILSQLRIYEKLDGKPREEPSIQRMIKPIDLTSFEEIVNQLSDVRRDV